MTLEELSQKLDLDLSHYRLQASNVPIIEGSLYNILGRQLFELYQKYEISSEDQRQMEALTYFLQSFALREDRAVPATEEKSSWWNWKK